MIRLTRFNKTEFFLSSDEILLVEARPDTTITLRDGTKYVVAEPPAEVYRRIVAFRAQIRFEAERRLTEGAGPDPLGPL